ncbi:MAG: homoserine kinase [Thermoanaerobaculia bacterium]
MNGRVRAFAPATVANLGPGFDVLGAALDGPGDTVSAWRSKKPGVRLVEVTGDRGRLPLDAERNTASVAAAFVLEAAVAAGRATARTGIELALEKGLPLASGLGSSAASAAAGAKAAALLLGETRKRVLLEAVLRGEHAADGSWHGDNGFASILGGLVLVPSSDPADFVSPVSLPVPPGLRLVLVHPDAELETKDARRVLPREIPLSEATRQAAALGALIDALHRSDLAAAGAWTRGDRIAEPRRRSLVPGWDEVTAAMKKAGALGWALAGAGPTILALSEEGPAPAKIAKAAERAYRALGVEAEATVHAVSPRGARPA